MVATLCFFANKKPALVLMTLAALLSLGACVPIADVDDVAQPFRTEFTAGIGDQVLTIDSEESPAQCFWWCRCVWQEKAHGEDYGDLSRRQ
jgi:hypothetical protein